MIDFQKRKSYIGGSDCAAAMGLSRYRTPYQLFIDKMNLENRKEETEAMYFGNKLEALLINEYSRRTGKVCAPDNKEIINPKYPWLIAHVDSWIDSSPRRILECKTTRFFNNNEWGAEGTDEIPIEYLLQVACYCVVGDAMYGVDGADIAALGSTSDFRIYHYSRNSELESLLIEKTKAFYENHMLTGTPPEPSRHDDLSKIYKLVKKESVMIATNELVRKADELKSISEKIKELEEQEQLLKNEIQLEMKDAENLIDISGQKIATWKNQSSQRLDATKLKAEKAEIYTAYLKSSESRVFRIK